MSSEPPYTEGRFDATSLPPPEELPDDVPKDVSNQKLDDALNNQEKTLYEILGASPTDSRAELKKKYVEMAKLSHPDAQIGRTDPKEMDTPDFGEIAAAWRVLGDTKSRKRYDRELQYKEWSAYASKYANEKLEEAVPAVAKIMDNVAVPFIRRTAATTIAVSQAVSNFGKATKKGSTDPSGTTDGKGSGRNSLTSAFFNAIRAGREAGRAIDSLELNEKSQELSERAQKDERRAREIQEQLSAVTEKRILASLQSDDLALSSDEAKLVLDRITSSEGESEREQNLHRIEKEIESLKATEQDFIEKLGIYEQSDREWNSLLERQETGKAELTRRKKEESDARKRLDEAIRLVSEAKANLVTTSAALRNVEQKVKRNASEMDRVTFTLSKKQEKVRHALRKKADDANGGIQLQYLSEEELVALRRKEMQLAGESQQLAKMVARLSSRAEKLRARADALDRFQKNGNFF